MSPDYLQRFSGIGRVYGIRALETFHRSHVCVIGVGGVGSWVVEALVRSGIRKLTLIDLDDLCITNINRQLPALTSTIGLPKTKVLADRAAQINPDCVVHCVMNFVTEANVRTLLDQPFDFIVDAVDRMSIKAAIIAAGDSLGKRVLTIGAAGGRTDPSQIKVTDLGMAGQDILLQQVRRKLRKDYGYEKADDGKAAEMNVPAVFSTQKPFFLLPDGTCSVEQPTSAEPGVRLDCADGFGALTHVTGSFGFAAAGAVLDSLSGRSASA